jgi:hypothetical protein
VMSEFLINELQLEVTSLRLEVDRLNENEQLIQQHANDLTRVVAHNARASRYAHNRLVRIVNRNVVALAHDGAIETRRCESRAKRTLRAQLTWAKRRAL